MWARQFAAPAPEVVWVTDITYIRAGRAGSTWPSSWTCSRAIVGWAMSDRITRQLTLDALGLALARRRPPRGLLHHSDRGSQYASGDYQTQLTRPGSSGG